MEFSILFGSVIFAVVVVLIAASAIGRTKWKFRRALVERLVQEYRAEEGDPTVLVLVIRNTSKLLSRSLEGSAWVLQEIDLDRYDGKPRIVLTRDSADTK